MVSTLAAGVIWGAVVFAALEAFLALCAQSWLRRRTAGAVLAGECGKVRRLAVQALADAALAGFAGLGGAAAVAEVGGPLLALPLAVALRACWGLPFAKGRRLGRDQVVTVVVAGLTGLALARGGGWLAAWAGWSAVVLWRELAPPWGRRLVPAGDGLWIAEGETQLNGRAEGIGWRRRIVLNDSLVQALSPDQLAAVVAHEAGHLRHRHREWFTLWRLAWGLLAALAVADAPLAGAVLVVLALPVLGFWLRPLETWMIRRWEEEADRHAVATAGAEAFTGALERLFGANATAPEPEPLWAAFHHPHPAPALRLASTKVGVAAATDPSAG